MNLEAFLKSMNLGFMGGFREFKDLLLGIDEFPEVKKFFKDAKEEQATQAACKGPLKIIKQGVIFLLSLTNPASGIVKAIKAIYDFVMWFFNNIQRIQLQGTRMSWTGLDPKKVFEASANIVEGEACQSSFLAAPPTPSSASWGSPSPSSSTSS